MSQRGRGYCPSCSAEYFNRSKPPNCSICGYALGGRYEQNSKKKKSLCPLAVKLTECDFSVKTSNRDDRCFVSTNGRLWFCSVEDCKAKRALYENSSRLQEFSCKHVVDAKNNSVDPLMILTPDLTTFVCSTSVREQLKDIVEEDGNRQPVIQVSETSYAVLGSATASNPLGYCHVRKSFKREGEYVCAGKDCRGFSSKAKQRKTKSMCQHVLLLRSCMQPTASTAPYQSKVPSANPSSIDELPIQNTKSQIKRASSITLAEKNSKIPYEIPRHVLQDIASRDAFTLLNVQGGWPELFIPEEENCQLCGSSLGVPTDHPGKQTDQPSYLITELNPFKKILIKVKFCQYSQCLAMHQTRVEKQGLFNISDKILISFDILLEVREFFKKGHPIGNVIEAKLMTLRTKCKEENNPTDNQIAYMEDLLYNGFFSFELLAERNFDDVICGVCGICPEICLGDGNEKNCCTNSQIVYTKKGEPQKSMITLEELLAILRRRWLEKTVYTRNQEPFSIAIEQLPPLIPPGLRSESIFNTEICKKSVYLTSNTQPTGDPALLHKMIVSGFIEMERISSYSMEDIVRASSSCGIPTAGKSKEYLCGMLNSLYEAILVGVCPCHGFGSLPGHTGGFYHIVCRHGTTVASKFLTLTESVRDAVDLYLSLKYQPTVFISDTPCGFVRHLECRDAAKAKQLWGENAGCFEKPEIGRQPCKDQNVPELVISEYRDNLALESTVRKHFVLGDRFHTTSEPHKSPLCQYHDIDLCLQANAVKTSTQESQNHRKNTKRLRSSCMQSFEVHLVYNYLMDFYQNEEIVTKQRKLFERQLGQGQTLGRDDLLRFKIIEGTSQI